MGIDSEQIQVPIPATDPAAAAPPAIQTPPYVAALPAAPAPDFQAPAAYAPQYEAPPAYAPQYETPPAYAPQHEAPAAAPIVVAPARSRPGWILPAAIAAVGLIASGSLGYLYYSTNNRLDATQHQLTETQLKLDSTQKDLATEKAQAAYVQLFEGDMGRESTDFATVVECDSYSSCRTAAQAMLSDTQAFQEDHQSAKVPAAYSNVDAMLGDTLTAEITALRDLLSALDTHDTNKIQAAFGEVNDASLSVFKTETSLGKLIA